MSTIFDTKEPNDLRNDISYNLAKIQQLFYFLIIFCAINGGLNLYLLNKLNSQNECVVNEVEVQDE